VKGEEAYLTLRTRKTAFEVCTATRFTLATDRDYAIEELSREKYVGARVQVNIKAGEEINVIKYAVNLSSENYPKDQLLQAGKDLLSRVSEKGFDTMLQEQAAAWAEKWSESDIIIKGDVEAQQGIRFNIFQLNQTYTGEDERLNIGPKGFTGEKYGGSTYWDTEAYCVPFYLATASPDVTRKLLIYRYKHLQKAIENAEKLGFKDGAALYPMVTINGEECHNEWEITFEEIHRNGAIAFAIYNYIRYTGDQEYLSEYGLEVLVAIARFWSQRVNWSEARKQYVMLGVTGPNEYENNVNNNWYTNTMACWCMKYAIEALDYVSGKHPDRYIELTTKMSFDAHKEIQAWKHIIDHMYYPKDEQLGVFLQQDGFLDKELKPVTELDPSDRPLNQKWSWDRILRSVYIKQADVLQGLYLLEDQFDEDTLRRNFDFYEPLTVHESSLSPCVHAILAAKLGDQKRAYEFYLRTSRLDLDDYNNDTEDGLHITSMAGTWMSVVEGFAGMRVRDGQLQFHPFLPKKWESFSFNVIFRGTVINISVDKDGVCLNNRSGTAITVLLFGKAVFLEGLSTVNVESHCAEFQ
jgi:maltose phosphorylase